MYVLANSNANDLCFIGYFELIARKEVNLSDRVIILEQTVPKGFGVVLQDATREGDVEEPDPGLKQGGRK